MHKKTCQSGLTPSPSGSLPARYMCRSTPSKMTGSRPNPINIQDIYTGYIYIQDTHIKIHNIFTTRTRTHARTHTHTHTRYYLLEIIDIHMHICTYVYAYSAKSPHFKKQKHVLITEQILTTTHNNYRRRAGVRACVRACVPVCVCVCARARDTGRRAGLEEGDGAGA